MNMTDRFLGFKTKYNKDFTTVPHVILETYLHTLSGSETKLLLFILRMLYGYQKTKDRISLSQFKYGNTETNKGTGLSTSQIRRALQTLEDKGFIEVTKRPRRINLISLVLSKDEVQSENKIDNTQTINKSQTDDLISMFVSVCPIKKIDHYLKNKRQVRAMNDTVEAYGYDTVRKIMKILPEIRDTEYCPIVTSPLELYDRIARLIIFIQRKQNEGISDFSERF